jgi:hypothetical protein
MARRVIKALPDANAGIEVGRNAVRVSGSRESFIYVGEDGLYLVGPISILSEPQDIRIAGTYTFPTAYKCAIPSTMVTPQPILEVNSPVEGFASIASEVARLLGELL